MHEFYMTLLVKLVNTARMEIATHTDRCEYHHQEDACISVLAG